MGEAGGATVERGPQASKTQKIVVAILCLVIMMVDGYDIGAMPILVTHLAERWQEEPANFGPALSAVVLGLGVGAFLFAPLGDRFGRRRTVVGSLALIGLATLGTASSSNVAELFWWRLLTGTALGACLPNVLAVLAETLSPRRRALAITLVSCGIPLGAALASGFGIVFLQAWGWQAVFVYPGLFIAALTILVALHLRGLPLPPAAQHAAASGQGWTRIPVLAPLGPGYLWRTVIFSSLFCCNALTMYMLSSWLPTVLNQGGVTFEHAAAMASIVQMGGLIGGLLLATQIDRQRTIGALLMGYAFVAVALIALAFGVPGLVMLGVLLLLIGMGVGGAHSALPAVAATIYPTTMLSAGIGLAVAVARIGAMAGPMVGAALIARNVSPGSFFITMLLPLMGCVLCVLAFARSRQAERLAAERVPAE